MANFRFTPLSQILYGSLSYNFIDKYDPVQGPLLPKFT